MECAAPEDRIPRSTHGYRPPTPPSSCSTRRGWRDAPPGCPRATAVPHSCTSTRWRGSRTSSRSCAPMARASRWCTRARITSSWCRPLSFGRKPVRFPKAAGRQERAGGCRGGGGMGIGMQGSAHADVADVGLQDLSSSSVVEHKTRGRGRHGMAWHMQSSRPAQLPCHAGLPRDRPDRSRMRTSIVRISVVSRPRASVPGCIAGLMVSHAARYRLPWCLAESAST
jgi:hypothetical protein